MKILYIYPHPDDESFGPAIAISRQRRAGHEVHLLTLTRGGATRYREKLGMTEQQMKDLRMREFERAARIMDLSGLTVLDLPDNRLRELDPREVEEPVRQRIARLRPDVLVTFPVHGISGHGDHLVTHAAVKRLYCEMKDNVGQDGSPRRLAFSTISPSQARAYSAVRVLSHSAWEDIDCIVEADSEAHDTMCRSLDAFETFSDLIDGLDVKRNVGGETCFEIFGEQHKPPLDDLTEGLG